MQNFPATSNMTDFEIVEMENERIQTIRTRMRQGINRGNNIEMVNDGINGMNMNIILQDLDVEYQYDNLLPQQRAVRFVDQVIPHRIQGQMPIPDPSLPNITMSNYERSDSSNDSSENSVERTFTSYTIEKESEKEEQNQLECEHNDTSASIYASFHSVNSGNSSNSVSTLSPTVTKDNGIIHNPPLTIRCNDITFIGNINNYNKRYVLSSMNPSYACSRDHNYFICHTCHAFPTQGSSRDKGLTSNNDHHFVRNIKAIIQHIRINHCKDKGEDKQLTWNTERYVLSKTRELGNPTMPLLQMMTSIPKSTSTSCLNTTWKSNQTDITKYLINSYYISPNPTRLNPCLRRCGGHATLIHTKGLAYTLDLADSIYCSCNAVQIVNIEAKINPKKYPIEPHNDITQINSITDKLAFSDAHYCLDDNTPMRHLKFIKYPGPDILPMQLNNPHCTDDIEPSFFHLQKMTRRHSPRIFLCQYTYRMNLPREISPTRTYPVGSLQTRSMTSEFRGKTLLQDKKIKETSPQKTVPPTIHKTSTPNPGKTKWTKKAATAATAAAKLLDVRRKPKPL